MNIPNSRLPIVFTTLLLMLTGCVAPPKEPVVNNTETPVQKNVVPGLAGSTWHYMDNDSEYDIQFLTNGRLKLIGHPNDTDFSNESWTQTGETVHIYFNDKFATYKGKFSGRNIISGTATNTRGVKWNWKLVREAK